MNPLATELNAVLAETVAGRLLSCFGQRMYFPKGIVVQSAEAGRRAKRFNATAGMACENGQPMILPAVRELTPGFSPAESVAYAPAGGDPEIRGLWKQEILAKNPSLKDRDFSLPIVVPGLTCGVAAAADMFVNPGDTLIMPDLYWDNYELIFADAKQAKCVFFSFFGADGRFNCAAFKEALQKNSAAGKLVILLNFPNNPTGYSPTRAEAQEIARIVKDCAEGGADILVISDDAYYGLFYDEETETQSLFAYFASLHERVLAIKVDGNTKEDFVWGFRVAFLSFGGRGLAASHYEALLTKTNAVLRASISNCSRIAQSIMIRAMKRQGYHAEKAAKLDILKKRYLAVRKILAARKTGKALRELPFNSGYFMSFRCHGLSSDKLRERLLEKGIGAISLQDRLLRVAYQSIDEPGLEEMFAEIFATADELLIDLSETRPGSSQL
ncbi:MAG: aminotransferase class I/II-fold pyridoxal phosphate-dependent enzyme [Spirochaetales bacterium]|jgi:aspartate/methionine/tyrosine aminotransferase|nr:aminotransferase class I/II-fold pyridoxal phosphate-dependent enzyme [Spirochaetales bacterium]